ncbi:MAG: DUF6754 domain-containing protein [Candidatus Methanomethylicia archaeon]
MNSAGAILNVEQIVAGRYLDLALLILMWVGAILVMNALKRGWTLKWRKIAGLEALEEAVGRAAEMGKPVHFTPGYAGLTGATSPQVVAGLAVFAELARLCAKYDVEIICSVGDPTVLGVATELYKQAYTSEGKLDRAKPEHDIRYLSGSQFAFAAAVQGIAERERPAANVMVGPFWAESMMFAETFYRVGSIQVAGTARIYQIPFFAVVCDYVIIGDEMFAAGAYLSKEPSAMSSIFIQDLAKLFALALSIFGALILTFTGYKGIIDFLKL